MNALPRPPLGSGWDRFAGWEDQFERMERWLQRLLRAHATANADELDGWHEFWDIAFVFFQNAYHLKAWISFEHPAMKGDLESLIETDPNLSYCADICNGTKHREVTRGHRVPGHLAGIREYAPHESTGQRFHIIGPDEPQPVVPLAVACVDAWRAFAAQHIRGASSPPAS